MIIPSFEKIGEVTDSRYALVILVSKRAKKLVDGSKPFVDIDSKKPVSIAIEEVMEKKIVFGEQMSNKEYEEKIEAEKNKKLEILKKEKLKNLNADEKDTEEK